MGASLEGARRRVLFQNPNLRAPLIRFLASRCSPSHSKTLDLSLPHSLPSSSQTSVAKSNPFSIASRNPALNPHHLLSIYMNHNPLSFSLKPSQISTSHAASGCSCSHLRLEFFSTSSCESSSSSGSRITSGVDQEKLAELIDLIVNHGKDINDLDSELSRVNPMLSHAAAAELLRSLNRRAVSALGFFNWLLNSNSGFKPSSEIFNLIVDNLGRSDDYDGMLRVLKELSLRKQCLTEKAFAFLTARGSSGLVDGVERATEILNRAGGSCRGSGIYSLIKILCAMSSFDLAISVMEETSRKTCYYNVLVAAKCRSGDFQDARDLFDEMRRFNCHPSIASYNYLLGSLFKNKRFVEGCELLETMEELGYLADPVTYEVLTVHACKANRMDFATEILNRMLSEGLRPRMTTHAAFIKGYFWSGRVEDAYKYVVDMNTRDKYSGNMNYSLLARLFQISGRVVEAGRVLHEMMEKGLKPNFPVYMKVIKDLYKMTSEDLASQLKSMYLKFDSSIDVG